MQALGGQIAKRQSVFSADGKLILTPLKHNLVIFAAATGETVTQLEGHGCDKLHSKLIIAGISSLIPCHTLLFFTCQVTVDLFIIRSLVSGDRKCCQ